MGEGQAYYTSVRILMRGAGRRLTDTSQQTPDCRYTEHIVEEQGRTRGELGSRGQREPKFTQ